MRSDELQAHNGRMPPSARKSRHTRQLIAELKAIYEGRETPMEFELATETTERSWCLHTWKRLWCRAGRGTLR